MAFHASRKYDQHYYDAILLPRNYARDSVCPFPCPWQEWDRCLCLGHNPTSVVAVRGGGDIHPSHSRVFCQRLRGTAQPSLFIIACCLGGSRRRPRQFLPNATVYCGLCDVQHQSGGRRLFGANETSSSSPRTHTTKSTNNIKSDTSCCVFQQ